MAAFFNKGDKQNQWIAKAEQAYEKGLYEDAAELFTKAAEAEPSNTNLWIKLAASQKYTGKYEAAERSYKKAVEANPDAGQAWIQLSILLGDSGRFEEALKALSNAALPENEIRLHERKCEWLERLGRYAEAAETAKKLCSANPSSKTYRVRLADLLLRAGRYAEAKEIYDELLRSENKYAADAGLCCELTGDTQSALFRYRQAEESDILARYRQARLKEAAGEFKEAAQSYAKIQQELASEDLSVSLRRAFSLMFSGNSKDAASLLEKLTAKFNSAPDLWYLLGAASFMNGSLKRAVEAFDTVIRIGSAPASIWYMKGAAEFLLGKYKEAVESFEKTGRMTGGASALKSSMFDEGDILFNSQEASPAKVEFETANTGLLSMQAVSLAALGKYSEADKAARLVLDSDSSRSDMELLRLRCLAGQGKYRQANDAFARVSAKNPDDYTILFEHAEILMLTGEYQKAAETWEKLLSLCPGNTLVYSRLAKAAVASGDYEGAKRAADLLLADVPHDLFALLAAGDASYAAGAYADSERYYAEAASVQENPDVFIGLGKAQLMLGKADEAKESFAKAGGSAGVRILEAKSAAEAGRTDEAVSLYMDILEKNPEILGVAGEVARLAFSLGRFSDAADAVSFAVSKNDAGFSLLRLGGDACLYSDRIDEAVSYYTMALEAEPENVSASAALAHVQILRGEYREALPLLKRAANAVKTGNCEAILSALKESSAVNPKNPYVLAGTAYLYAVSGHPTEALSFFDKAESAGCRDLDLYCSRAFIYLSQSRFDMCDKAASEALKIRPSNRTALRLKARALEGLGRFEEAVSYYNLMLEE